MTIFTIILVILAAIAGTCGVVGARVQSTYWNGVGVTLLAIDLILLLLQKFIV